MYILYKGDQQYIFTQKKVLIVNCCNISEFEVHGRIWNMKCNACKLYSICCTIYCLRVKYSANTCGVAGTPCKKSHSCTCHMLYEAALSHLLLYQEDHWPPLPVTCFPKVQGREDNWPLRPPLSVTCFQDVKGGEEHWFLLHLSFPAVGCPLLVDQKRHCSQQFFPPS